MACTSTGCISSARTAITDTPNEPSIASEARPPDSSRGSRRPARLFSRNPRSGRSGMRRSTLSLQFPEGIGVQALDVPEERRGEVLAAVKQLGMDKRRLVTDEEFREIVGRT